jgi:hypothetical protein
MKHRIHQTRLFAPPAGEIIVPVDKTNGSVFFRMIYP